MDRGHGIHAFGDIVYAFCRIGMLPEGGRCVVERADPHVENLLN